MNERKIVVIGLDGGTWNIILPLIKKGELPTLKYLLENGCWGDLESTIPPYTGPAWVSFATGRNPGKHGVFDFLKVDREQNKLKLVTTKDIKVRTFYEYLDMKGFKTILINIPMLYPLNLKYSIQVADMLTKNSSELIIPAEIKNKYAKLLKKYKVYPETAIGDEFLIEVENIENNRFKLARKLFLYENWDLFSVVFSGTDWISHGYYKIFKSTNNKLKNKIIRFYKQIDNYIYFFKNNLPKNGFLFVISDHGFKELKGRFYINEYFKKYGLVVCENSPPDDNVFKRIHRNSKKTIEISPTAIKLIGMIPILNKMLRAAFLRFKKLSGIRIKKRTLKIDYCKSSAFCPTISQYGVFVNNINKKFVLNLLKNASYNGERIIEKVWYRDEIYSGPYVNLAPDILFLTNKTIAISSVLSGKIFMKTKLNLEGQHDINGIFIAYGTEVKKNKKIEKAKIYDLAPTILYLFKLPIPRDMDGRVLEDIFIKKSYEPFFVTDSYHTSEKEILKIKIKRIKSKINFK